MDRIEFYSDYRRYLKDFYLEQKRHRSFFSYRYFCRKAGISSPALFKEVVEGIRNLTERTTELFIKGLGLPTGEAAYFRALVHFNQTENDQEKLQALERMRGLRTNIKQEIIPLDLFDYFSTWYYPVIRELACLLDWNGDFRLLARALIPAIKKSEAERAIKFLLEKGFLNIDEKGRYHQTNPALSTGSEVSSLAIRAFNEIMASRGVEAIRRFPPSERDVRTVIAGLSAKSYALIKEEIREFIARVVRIVDDDRASDRVYSLNLQLFPISQSNKQGDSSHEDE